MKVPTKDEVRTVLVEIVFAMAVEEVAARLGHRLRHGRRCPECGAPSPKRRPVRRMAGALLAEVAAEGAAEIYRERRRMASAVDRFVIDAESRSRSARPRIPQQRSAPPIPAESPPTPSAQPVPSPS